MYRLQVSFPDKVMCEHTCMSDGRKPENKRGNNIPDSQRSQCGAMVEGGVTLACLKKSKDISVVGLNEPWKERQEMKTDRVKKEWPKAGMYISEQLPWLYSAKIPITTHSTLAGS